MHRSSFRVCPVCKDRLYPRQSYSETFPGRLCYGDNCTKGFLDWVPNTRMPWQPFTISCADQKKMTSKSMVLSLPVLVRFLSVKEFIMLHRTEKRRYNEGLTESSLSLAAKAYWPAVKDKLLYLQGDTTLRYYAEEEDKAPQLVRERKRIVLRNAKTARTAFTRAKRANERAELAKILDPRYKISDERIKFFVTTQPTEKLWIGQGEIWEVIHLSFHEKMRKALAFSLMMAHPHRTSPDSIVVQPSKKRKKPHRSKPCSVVEEDAEDDSYGAVNDLIKIHYKRIRQ